MNSRSYATRIYLPLAEPARPAVAKSLGRERIAEGAQGVWEVADRRVEVIVGRDLSAAHESDSRSLVHQLDELVEAAVDYLGVRIEEEDVARVARHQRAVVRVPESMVVRRYGACFGELARHDLRRVVERAIVYDDYVGADITRWAKTVGNNRRIQCASFVETMMIARSWMVGPPLTRPACRVHRTNAAIDAGLARAAS